MRYIAVPGKNSHIHLPETAQQVISKLTKEMMQRNRVAKEEGAGLRHPIQEDLVIHSDQPKRL